MRTEENGGTAIHVAVEERSHLALHVMMSHFEDEDFEYLMTLTNGEGLNLTYWKSLKINVLIL